MAKKKVEVVEPQEFTVVFEEEGHHYWKKDKDGNTIGELISVTTLLAKHGISASWSGVDADLLNKAADRGTRIHKAIEEFTVWGESFEEDEFSEYVDAFAELYGHIVMVPKSEVIVNNDICAGTVDLLYPTEIIDIKTGSTIHKTDWAWQMSIYDYLAGGDDRNLEVAWLNDPKTKKRIPIERIPTEEIEKLMECERKGTLYQARQLPAEYLTYAIESVSKLKFLLDAVNTYEQIEKEVREKLLTAMMENGVESVTVGGALFSLVKESERTTVDSKKLKEDYPEIYPKVTKTSKVKPSVRIKFYEETQEGDSL
jgi:hypothetical protein